MYVFMYIHNYVYMYVSVGPPSSFGPNQLSPCETQCAYVKACISQKQSLHTTHTVQGPSLTLNGGPALNPRVKFWNFFVFAEGATTIANHGAAPVAALLLVLKAPSLPHHCP